MSGRAEQARRAAHLGRATQTIVALTAENARLTAERDHINGLATLYFSNWQDAMTERDSIQHQEIVAAEAELRPMRERAEVAEAAEALEAALKMPYKDALAAAEALAEIVREVLLASVIQNSAVCRE